MTDERRKNPRVDTHIVSEIVVAGETKQYYGYIENLSESGMGVVSLDPLPPGAQISSGFYLSDEADKLRPQASLVHTRTGPGSLFYHGFRFEYLREGDRNTLVEFIQTHLDTGGAVRA